MEHELKTWPEPFARIDAGVKTYEVRRSDRDFQVGDTLCLREWDPRPGPSRLVGRQRQEGVPRGYTGNELYVRVVHITMPGQWGLPADVCVMGIELIKEGV